MMTTTISTADIIRILQSKEIKGAPEFGEINFKLIFHAGELRYIETATVEKTDCRQKAGQP